MQKANRLVWLIAILSLLATACSTSSSTSEGDLAPAQSSADGATTSVMTYTTMGLGPSVDFARCGQDSECAVFQVPLDYDAPFGKRVNLHVTRHRATGDRIGSLFLNPGGPGGSVMDMVDGMGQFGPPPIIERFDLIGIDPRGTGGSDLLDCNPNWEEDTLFEITPEDGLADDIDAFTADFADMASACEAEFDLEFLASLTTENAARDLEFVRLALDDEPLNYLGYSYGTAIGSVYATLFPDTVRAMILDGAVPNDPADSDIDGWALRHEQALLRLDRACDLWAECPVGNPGLLQTIEDVRGTMKRDGQIGPLRPHVLERAVGALVPVPAAMPDVAEGLAQALEGDGSMLADIGQSFLTPIPTGGFEEYTAAFPAIICADGWNLQAGTTAELLPQVERTLAASPVAGPYWETPCDLWPVTGSGIPPASYTGTAPILVIGNTHDPITPLVWSKALADDLGPNATLLTWDGSGHTAVFNAPGCIDEHAFAYLIDGTVPALGTICPLEGVVGLKFTSDPVAVAGLIPGSPADDAGLEIGDRIVAINGNPISVLSDLPDSAASQTAEMLIERDGEEIELTIGRDLPVWELWRNAD